ncbi:tetratricopeptide repeat protein [Vampirovibrio sp.]|uniref:tetratricopeptide repeat protein n=1 Tax=Vampirovibrio sp. TaxID=2717857 RepID=UPI003593FE6D
MVVQQDSLAQALTYHQRGDLTQAIAEYRHCIQTHPTAVAYTNLGVALRTQGHIKAAIAAYRNALTLDANYVPALSNLGGGLRALGQLDEAIVILKQALMLQPDFAAAHYNLGLTYMDFQQPEKAIACFDAALRLEPQRVDAPFDRAVCLLQTGDLLAGFRAYECRFAYEPRLQRSYVQPAWQGESLQGKTLLLYSEQGFGDTLQFIRFAAHIEKAGGQLILECPQPLQRLMQTLPYLDQVVCPQQPMPVFDTHCALLSLPAVMGTTLENIPNETPYLKPLPLQHKTLPLAISAKRIGLVWSSGHADVGTRQRSISLNLLIPLLTQSGCEFYSFQKGPAVAALKDSGLESLIHNLDAEMGDFADTAALLQHMDLLISVDTAMVHLAGALNIPCWALLPSGSEWRWFSNRTDTPWYPSVRLFRQEYGQAWEEVIQGVSQALQGVMRERMIQSARDTMPVNPVIFYHPEGFSTTGSKLMGRQAAGESFLKAWCQHSGFERVHGYGLLPATEKVFAQQVQQFSQKAAHWSSPNDSTGLTEAGCLFLPGPGLGEWAWQRRMVSNSAYSLCGITHTTASDRVMDSIGELLTAPTQPWDALICTSHPVKAMVEQVLGEYQAYLRERFQSKSLKCPVQLPVIPLGIEASALAPTEAKRQAGQQLRQTLNIPAEAVVFLFMGRLSFHAKAHPYPMMVSLEAAAQQTGKKLVLLLAGWFANAAIQAEFEKAAALWCPSVAVIVLDGRKPDIREKIWAAADVFTSLSDNIQETFGLTPLEAKAAGLPVVASDWDGYRETIREGLDGYLIPTCMPGPGMGKDLAYQYLTQHDSYDLYIGKTSQSIAVDIPACTQAYVRLINDLALRKQLGAQGQQDAQARFDWPVILTQYQQLWQELAQIRKASGAMLQTGAEAPLRQDPYRLFANYPNHALTPQTHVLLLDKSCLISATRLSMNRVAEKELGPLVVMEQLLQILETSGGCSLERLHQQLSTLSSPVFYRTVGWLAKMGVVSCLGAGKPLFQ